MEIAIQQQFLMKQQQQQQQHLAGQGDGMPVLSGKPLGSAMLFPAGAPIPTLQPGQLPQLLHFNGTPGTVLTSSSSRPGATLMGDPSGFSHPTLSQLPAQPQLTGYPQLSNTSTLTSPGFSAGLQGLHFQPATGGGAAATSAFMSHPLRAPSLIPSFPMATVPTLGILPTLAPVATHRSTAIMGIEAAAAAAGINASTSGSVADPAGSGSGSGGGVHGEHSGEEARPSSSHSANTSGSPLEANYSGSGGGNKSRYRGVSYDRKKGKWRVQIKVWLKCVVVEGWVGWPCDFKGQIP